MFTLVPTKSSAFSAVGSMAMISRARRMLEGLRSAAVGARRDGVRHAGRAVLDVARAASGPAWHRAARRGAARAAPDAPRREDAAGARSAAADVVAAAASICVRNETDAAGA